MMNPDAIQPNDPKINLVERFPNIRPVKRVPLLSTVNGIGCGMYGHRDEDSATGAYVKTHCFCLFFIPLFAFGAYRVVDSREGGWYFLGTEPLSRFARMWNGFLLTLILVGASEIAWNAHVTSPEYVARKDLRLAQAQLHSGDLLDAAGQFAKLITGPVSTEARSGLQTALERCLQSESVPTVEGAFRLLARLGAGVNRSAPLVPDAFGRGAVKVEKLRAANPDGALRVLNAVAELDPKNESLPGLRLGLLKDIVAAQPENLDRVVELALAYEKATQTREAVTLLHPRRDQLGSTEGARILGQQLLQEGQHAEAYGLLYPYVQARLTRLHTIERAYTNALAGAYQGALNRLRNEQADSSFYAAYRQASKAGQEEMVEKFVQKSMQNDPSYRRALEQFKEANQIVHVTLDLGIVQINRAQAFPEPARRKAELEEAEKTFLAIRGLAGETDEYRLFLGQVYYWLGRAPEGQALFDELLRSRNRSFSILLALGGTLREVGEDKQARELLEEAYRAAAVPRSRYQAAALRAVLARDISDKIAWLTKADTSEASTQVALNSARGEQALEQGNKEAAAGYLRKAISGYESMTRNATVLNNTAVACLSLYEVTGQASDLNRGLDLLEQAVAMEPGNSILLVNTMQLLVSRAIMDLVRDAVRLELVKEHPDPSLFAFLYDNEAERTAVFQRLRASGPMKKALSYLDRAILLAPKSRSLYVEHLVFLGAFRDQAEMQRLQQRIRAAQLDENEALSEARDSWKGAKDRERLDELHVRMRRYEDLIRSEPVRRHPGTLEYVTVSLNNSRLAAAQYGEKLDYHKVVESARAAYETRHSSATRQSLVVAHWAAALAEVSGQNDEIAAVRKQTSRLLSAGDLLTFLLEQRGAASDLIRRNPNVQQALRLEKEGTTAFPSLGQASDWALFRWVDPAEAERVARALKENESSRLAAELQFHLAPASGHAILTQYWGRKLAGDEPGAKELYERACRNGIPLPRLAAPSPSSGKLAGGE